MNLQNAEFNKIKFPIAACLHIGPVLGKKWLGAPVHPYGGAASIIAHPCAGISLPVT